MFDVALFVPASLSVEYDDPFQPFAAFWNTPFVHGSYDKMTGPAVVKANAFALQLMLVCKCWHNIAISKLYRRLRVRSHRYCEPLARRLASPSREGDSSSPTLGCLVRRIDLIIDDLPLPGQGWETLRLYVEHMFSHLLNLQILQISSQ